MNKPIPNEPKINLTQVEINPDWSEFQFDVVHNGVTESVTLQIESDPSKEIRKAPTGGFERPIDGQSRLISRLSMGELDSFKSMLYKRAASFYAEQPKEVQHVKEKWARGEGGPLERSANVFWSGDKTVTLKDLDGDSNPDDIIYKTSDSVAVHITLLSGPRVLSPGPFSYQPGTPHRIKPHTEIRALLEPLKGLTLKA